MKKFFSVSVFALLLVTQISFAQFGTGINIFNFNLNGNGARAVGMGYAFTAVSDDASAISWNPAGLTQLYSPEASIVGRFGFGTGSVEGFEDLGIDSWDVELSSNFQLNFVSIVFPFSVGNFNVVGGIAYRRMYDFTREITNTMEGGGNQGEDLISNDGGINAISPSIGVQLHDMISVGATINILTGSEKVELRSTFNDVTINEVETEVDYSGMSIDLGILVKPTDQISFGANLNLPHTRTFEWPDVAGDVELDIDAPLFFTLGAAFRPSDAVLIAFDYQHRPISDLELEGVKVGDLLGFEDFNSFHVGLEYITGGEGSVMPLRVGFYTQPMGQVDEKGDQVIANVFTAGLGIVLNNLILDGGVEWAHSSFVIDQIGDQDIEISANEFRVTVGAVVHFGE